MIRSAFLLIMLIFWGQNAAAQSLLADLSSHIIAIQTDFQGQDLILFGTIDQPIGPQDHLIIVVRGPTETVDIRQKGKLGSLWINETSKRFYDIPSFHHVYSYGLLKNLPLATLTRQELTLDTLKLNNKTAKDPFRQALINHKKALALYKEDTTSIVFRGDHLFRADVTFPVRVKTGQYSVTIYLFRAGEITAAQTTPLLISKDGIGAEIFFFAHNHAFWYGCLGIVLAVFSGWLAFIVMRKRSL